MSVPPSLTTEDYVGIDVGTTYCSIGYYDLTSNEARLIVFNSSTTYLYSSVTFTSEKKVVIGNSENFVNNFCYIKRIIGLPYERIRYPEFFPFQINSKGTDEPTISLSKGAEELSPTEVTAMIIRNLKTECEQTIKRQVTRCVVTVPAHFEMTQVDATILAAKMAGFETVYSEKEPSAAAFAFIKEKQIRKGNVLVFDFGGGTLDVTLLRGIIGEFRVDSTVGDMDIGGIDIDDILSDIILKKIYKEDRQMFNTIKSHWESMKYKLRKISEKAKVELSRNSEVEISLTAIGMNRSVLVTKIEFENNMESIVKKCKSIVVECISKSNSKIDEKDIDSVVLVGGSSQIRVIEEMIEKIFKGKVVKSVNRRDVVAIGAVYVAHELFGKITRINDNKTIERTLKIEKGSLSIMNRTPYDIQTMIYNPKSKSNELLIVLPKNTLFGEKHYLTGKTHIKGMNTITVTMYENKRNIGTFVFDKLPKTEDIEFTNIFFVDRNGVLSVETKVTKPQQVELSMKSKFTTSAQNLRLTEERKKIEALVD
ncbi:chaperone protein DNAK, putative [Entamoeba invadens IP1]|uniref:Chaperone protein DNAK, putative n=1 Tax=Entamoeba invadens IP1 TaxID=370355 RepID=A0A0A1UF92_ENTIV|nr:chaperone protein DNAK, putative [Entamoeba invadens IP1]ELP92614.1 chaperone protein DNAK, putative [Entamoeba invadens IP1]|eukprot:XP_004259385.1 chaperone protein DNAK, putative [Entamoeba invadens IP1]